MKFSLSRADRQICFADILRFLIVVVVLAGVVAGSIFLIGGTDKAKDKIDDALQGSNECKHEWVEATCKSAKTCSLCGAREGSTLAHQLVNATCTTPKMCTVCETVWGEPFGHNWKEANCTEPKTCKTCGETEGEAPGHDWTEADCTVAKTCNVCKLIEGKALGHDLTVEEHTASCTEDGYTLTTCSRCDFEETTNEVPKLGHLNDVKLEFVAPTCTDKGLSEGIYCSRCEKITVPQTTIQANGHKHTILIDEKLATCKAEGYKVWECSVCQDKKTEILPILPHDFGEATCTDAASCINCGFDNGGEPIGHSWVDATCDTAKYCSRCNTYEGEALGHDMSQASCIAPSTCSRCGHTEGERKAHVLKSEFNKANVKYVCELCGTSFKLGNFLLLDGSGYDGMYGVPSNGSNGYIVQEAHGNHYPIITEEGYYALLKEADTDAKKQLQIWLPSEDKTKTDFTADNGAVGFLSFKFNGYMDSNLDMKIIDGGSGADRWSAGWHIIDPFFNLLPPAMEEGREIVKVTGWNELVLKTVDITDSADKFTGWFDVKIGIVLDADSDTIVMHYYIDGAYVGSESKPLTTISNAVNCVYISGNSCAGGSGVMLDDVVFGYTVAGDWQFDGAHTHSWSETSSAEPTCTTDGFVMYECQCGAVRRSSVPALGHVKVDVPGLEPTCTEAGYTNYVSCSVCTAVLKAREDLPALGHDYVTEKTDPTCTEMGHAKHVCSVCTHEYEEDIPALGHTYGNDADCTAGAVCTVCGTETTEPIGHDFAPATCYTPATCNRCGVTEGDVLEHVMAPATCTKPSTCTLCGTYTEGTTVPHTLAHKYERNKLTYYCTTCDASYTLDKAYFLDGTTTDNMTGNPNNKNNFTVSTGTDRPKMVDGHYEFINTTDARGQLQMWIPVESSENFGFSAKNNAVGFFSFKINANFTEEISLHLVDGPSNQGDARWHDGGIAGKLAFSGISSGVITVKLGHVDDMANAKTIASLPVDSTNFTGWVDIKLGIELDPVSDQITYHVYIDGKHVTTFSIELTTTANSINCIYLSGYTTGKGTGIMLDDIGFGYAADGEWLFDDCDHDYKTTVVAPGCEQDGYTLESCDKCGRKNYSNVTVATGHTGGEADCDDRAICDNCGQPYGEPLGHIGGTATCTVAPVCDRCGETYGTAQHTMSEASCYGPAKCSVCGHTEGGSSTHNPVVKIVDGKLVYECKYCGKYYKLDKGYYHDGTTSVGNIITSDEGGAFVGGAGAVINADGQYEFIHDDTNKSTKGSVWVPTNSNNNTNFEDFSNANGAVGVFSISMNAYIPNANGLGIQLVDTDLRGVSGNFWGEGAITSHIINISQPSSNVVTVKGWGGELMKINVTDDDKWTGWLDFDIGIVMNSNNTITAYYYINGVYVTSGTTTMNITTGKIDGIYFNAVTTIPGSGYMFDNIAFGYAIPASHNNEDIFKGEGYTGGNTGDNTESDKLDVTPLDKGSVTDSALLTINESKIKQFDGCTVATTTTDKETYGYFTKEGGVATYVTVDKGGSTVEALYFSRTPDWPACSDSNANWAEHRYTLDTSKTVQSISFDYLIKGTVTDSGAELGENVFQIRYADLEYENRLVGNDVYVEDGEWHTFTYEFVTPVSLMNFLIKLHHFQGEMLIANISVVYAS